MLRSFFPADVVVREMHVPGASTDSQSHSLWYSGTGVINFSEHGAGATVKCLGGNKQKENFHQCSLTISKTTAMVSKPVLGRYGDTVLSYDVFPIAFPER